MRQSNLWWSLDGCQQGSNINLAPTSKIEPVLKTEPALKVEPGLDEVQETGIDSALLSIGECEWFDGKCRKSINVFAGSIRYIFM